MRTVVIVQQHVKQQQSANVTAGKTIALYINRNKPQIHHGIEFSMKVLNLDSTNNSTILYVKDYNVKKYPICSAMQ